jgi:hypothetical protein
MSAAAGLVPALEQLAATLTDAGVRASVDRNKVNAPGAWITPATLDVTTLAGGGEVRVHVYLIAPTSLDDLGVLRTLGGLLEVALDPDFGGLAPVEPVDCSVGLQLPHTSTTFPAFRLTVDLDL